MNDFNEESSSPPILTEILANSYFSFRDYYSLILANQILTTTAEWQRAAPSSGSG